MYNRRVIALQKRLLTNSIRCRLFWQSGIDTFLEIFDDGWFLSKTVSRYVVVLNVWRHRHISIIYRYLFASYFLAYINNCINNSSPLPSSRATGGHRPPLKMRRLGPQFSHGPYWAELIRKITHPIELLQRFEQVASRWIPSTESYWLISEIKEKRSTE